MLPNVNISCMHAATTFLGYRNHNCTKVTPAANIQKYEKNHCLC